MWCCLFMFIMSFQNLIVSVPEPTYSSLYLPFCLTGDGIQGHAFLWKLTGQCFYCILRRSPPLHKAAGALLCPGQTQSLLSPGFFPLAEEYKSCAVTSDAFLWAAKCPTFCSSAPEHQHHVYPHVPPVASLHSNAKKSQLDSVELFFFQDDFYWENYKKNVQYKVNSLTLNL